jgi:hypothetical protein
LYQPHEFWVLLLVACNVNKTLCHQVTSLCLLVLNSSLILISFFWGPSIIFYELICLYHFYL